MIPGVMATSRAMDSHSMSWMKIWSHLKIPLFPWWGSGKKRRLEKSVSCPDLLKFDQSHQQISTSLNLGDRPESRCAAHQRHKIANPKEQSAAKEAENQKLAEALEKQARNQPPLSPEGGNSLQTALAHLGQWGIVNRDLYEFFDQATRLIRTTLGLDYCGLWELLPNRSALLLCAGDGWKKSLVGSYTIDATHRSYAGYTIYHNGDRPPEAYEPVIAADLRVTQKFRASPLLQNLGVISGVNVMVAGPRNPFGVLGIYSVNPRQFTEAEIDFLTVTSHILAGAIDRQEYEEKLRLLERAIDASSNGILITDALGSDNPIIYANQGVETITGFGREEIIGQNCRFLSKSDRQGEQGKKLEKLRTAIALGKECEVVLKNYRKDGSPFWNHLYISPVYNQQNFLVNFIGIQTDVTQQKLAEQQLRESEEFFSSIIGTITDGLLIVDKEGIIQFVNPAAQKMFKREELALLQQPFGLPFVADQLTEITLTPLDGTVVVAEMRVSPIHWQKSEAFLVSLRDITEQHQARSDLAESEKKYRHIVELTSEGIWILDQDQETIFANEQLADILGYSVEEILQRNISSFILSIYHLPESNQGHQQSLQSFPSCVLPNHDQVYDIQLQRQDGGIVWGLVSRSAWYDEWGNYCGELAMLTDITERKAVTEKLYYNANHDPLTNLPNRLLFLDRLDHALQRNLRRQNGLFAVLFLDLDGFKIINDSLGHAYGDLLLQGIAQRLKECLRPQDTLARLGGDEFTMLIEDITCPEDAIAVAQRIHHVLQKPFNLKGQEIFTNTSIGLALNHGNYGHPQDILRDADTAMYRAKAAGKGRYAIFDQTMHHHAVQRLQRENDLRRAIDRQELVLHFQPIICLKTGQLHGFEALVRWNHPDEGLIFPAEFVAIAEETGLILPMGDWILWEACQQLLKIKEHFPHLPQLQVSVNVSSRQMRDHRLLEKVDEILAKTALNPQDLKLEMTETLLMDNLDLATDVLLALRERNIEISLDDFGTGYSSLSYLHRFPINTLKVDRSFVTSMKPNDENTAIVHTILALAHSLGLDVIAEGIETEMQLTQLHNLGCELGQGYYFSPPIPPEQLVECLASKIPHWAAQAPYQYATKYLTAERNLINLS